MSDQAGMLTLRSTKIINLRSSRYGGILMQAKASTKRRFTGSSILTLLVMLAAATIMPATTWAQGGSPVLALSHSVSQEPLLAGQVAFTLNVRNNGATAVTDRGYNLTITDTLPVGLTYMSADPAPTNVARQPDGTTALAWDNIADLEANESLGISIVATLANTVTVATDMVNRAGAKVNTMPDNSGAWVTAFSELSTRPQAIDIETSIIQSTAEEQAMGAGEYANAPGRGAGADWPFQARVSIRNNNVGTTNGVVARVTLPRRRGLSGQCRLQRQPQRRLNDARAGAQTGRFARPDVGTGQPHHRAICHAHCDHLSGGHPVSLSQRRGCGGGGWPLRRPDER
jgi:uncharacterized repeat protein (TIGR01451 family)